MLFASKLRDSKKWENLYGGLVPAIVAPTPTKQSPDTILTWVEGEEESHLLPHAEVQNSQQSLLSPQSELLDQEKGVFL